MNRLSQVVLDALATNGRVSAGVLHDAIEGASGLPLSFLTTQRILGALDAQGFIHCDENGRYRLNRSVK